MYGNECILPHETPSSLGMKDGDVIDFAGSNTVNVLIYYGSPLQRRTFLVKKTDTLTNVLHVFCMHLVRTKMYRQVAAIVKMHLSSIISARIRICCISGFAASAFANPTRPARWA